MNYLVIPTGCEPEDESFIFDGLPDEDDPEDTRRKFRRLTWIEVAEANQCTEIHIGSDESYGVRAL